jgi:hypothetical protein
VSGPEAHGAATVASEAARYLEAIDLFRSLGLDLTWRCETEELAAPCTAELCCESRCDRCASPSTRINGRHVCLGVR